jgi:hypothetical protein
VSLPHYPVQQPATVAIASDTASRKQPASGGRLLLVPDGMSLPPARRLVVLVPDLDLDETALARRIWNLAAPSKLAVLYLGLSHATSVELHARRQLATLAALTRDDGVPVSTAIATEVDWLGALRPRQRNGDVIVCHAEQTAPSWRGARPLGKVLCQSLHVPVQLLEGFYAGDPAPAARPAARFMFWGGSVAILAGAFWLQLQISTRFRSWPEIALLVLSVVAECGLIGLWSRAIK